MTPVKILVVEDDLIVARDIQGRLQRLGYEVVGTTRYGEEAVRLADQLRPNMVLMDIRLEGEMDGVVAADQIRSRFHLPVVFLTAYADEDTLQRARVSEPFGYILKPFEERELRTVIEMGLHKYESEKKLRASERRFAVTLNSIGDAVIATDDKGRVTFMNPVAVALTGWPPADATGRSLSEVFRIVNEMTGEPAEDPATNVLRLASIVGLADRTMLVSRDGGQVPIDDSGAPIIDDSGSVTGVVLVFQNVTERRRAEEELTLFRTLIDAANDAIEVVDPETGCFLDVNEKACAQHGFTREEYLSLRVGDLDTAMDDPSVWAQRAEHIRSAGSRMFEGHHKRKDGSIFPVEVNVTYVHQRRDYLVAVVRDITERRRAEAERTRIQAVLSRTEHLAALGSLVAGVAHEVRNPLFSLGATFDAFLTRFGNHPEYEPYRIHIQRELNRLTQLTHDLLDYGKPHELTFSVGSLAEVIQEAIEDCARMAEEARVDVHTVPAVSFPHIRMDRIRLRQLFENLIQNAVQNTPQGGSVTIETGPIDVEGTNWIQCAVADSGPGFREEDLPKIFELFFSRRKGGTGLGLAIVQRIVDEHGGTIVAANRPEGGAVMTVRLAAQA